MHRPASTAWVTAIVLVVGAATIGSAYPPGAWYAQLQKPWFTPPNAAFPIVWTTLYVMIAIAGARLLGTRDRRSSVLWLVQLALNAAWSWIFFGRHEMGLALLDIVLLEIFVLGTIASAWRRNRIAALLLVPYAAWVLLALALNLRLWQLNR